MSVGNFLVGLLFPPTCRGCGERRDIFREHEPLPLCPTCLEQWARAKQSRCDQCGCAVSECVCPSPVLKEAGCTTLVKAVRYHPDQKRLPERLILRGKRMRDRELFRFFAADLQLPLWQALERVGGTEQAVVTYIPRRAYARAQEGVDQGYELARAIGRAMELPVARTLCNRGKAAQKTLDQAQRQQHASRAIRLHRRADADVRGKTIVLVDDISTVGATLSAATRILLDAGARQVVCCVVGCTRQHETQERA